jgi:hypothetical protein
MQRNSLVKEVKEQEGDLKEVTTSLTSILASTDISGEMTTLIK